jgi:hypothetical protein
MVVAIVLFIFAQAAAMVSCQTPWNFVLYLSEHELLWKSDDDPGPKMYRYAYVFCILGRDLQ